jgi:hypothetical protein
MKTVTIQYGVDTIVKTMDCEATYGDIRQDDNIKAVLGYGDNVSLLTSGVAQADHTIIPENAKVVIETKANTKAS